MSILHIHFNIICYIEINCTWSTCN